ncbi:tungsten formylmethanofuran dehydrogenase subunit E [Flavobacterium noncentrifugens]|uniref:3-methyl-2-oxobutanoate dehydrogenase (2-methylpropanoyl-transferring) n=1 Tax=Flavobacterium noncentrifugens TaxID=1128970 RepID=A0A1G8RCE7_9FLAO|nr:alpha-ketoacid dehydrogenase subunit alpha/beta [Flavobacterium noncentrifugens]GEP49377.1 tungsten formylmethanofuran dehydrogenase subunit E [Flavobacterium noncentrifugens]SDJ14628.1 2-oxoisovalerate dehydrogenase E1 component [Flavobacterium noncentrifugens]
MELLQNTLSKIILEKAFSTMATAKAMAELYEENFKVVSKYVHATSRGHEAIQIAVAMQLLPQDYAFPYYRDDAMLLGIGMQPYDLMLQLMAKKDDPFSGGRTYYCHPSLRDADKPKIPHQSSATGMQAIPATGAAMGFWYKENVGIQDDLSDLPVVVCSLGDASVTEGEVAEAFQMAALKQLPILYLVQDNGWDISANAKETRAQNAFEYAKGFHGIEAISIDGADFTESYLTIQKVLKTIRTERRPFLVHAKVPLLNHHTSGVRMEWYRDDLDEARSRDPYPVLKQQLLDAGFTSAEIEKINGAAVSKVQEDYDKAIQAEDPKPEDLFTHDFAPTPITEEKGERNPEREDKVVMVDCALFAVEELMKKHPEALLYGQDVGGRLGGVFREAATLAQKFGDDRVFNTPIQEAFIVGSTVGMSAVGLKPIVEVQFADYIWPGLNQLFTEVSRSCYLSNGKWPVSMILRVPIGAYGSGGPYHSSSVESILTNIRGIKIAYPSNGADLKGLLKAAYYDPNPVVFLEHKGLYWSKVKGTEAARVNEPSEDYVLPFGKANVVQEIWEQENEETISVITYGMGVHWALNASADMQSKVEIIDLRTLFPLDEETILRSVRKNKKCLVVTEEPTNNSFARSLAGMIQEKCFKYLDAPVMVIGSENMPAIPLNATLEQTMIPSMGKVKMKMEELLNY